MSVPAGSPAVPPTPPAATFAADLAKANEWINSGIPDGTPEWETMEVIAGLVDELDRRAGAVPDSATDDTWTARDVEIMTGSLRLTVRRTARMLRDALDEQERLEAALAEASPSGKGGQDPARTIPVLVARCDSYDEGRDRECPGLIRFRWGQGQSSPCDTCGGRCGISVATWERVEHAGAVPDTGPAHAPGEWAAEQARGMRSPRLVLCPRQEHPSFLVDSPDAMGCPWCVGPAAGSSGDTGQTEETDQ